MFFPDILAVAAGVAFAVQVAIQVAVAYAAYWVASQFASSSKQRMPEASNYPVQTSMKGIPIAKVYGTRRVAGNIIWLGGLHPYTVRHSVGGGKGGGGESHAYETRFRRSFLIGIAEGPASIIRAWKGKNEIPLSDFTTFEGLGSATGLTALTGEDYGEYPNLCCAFFDEYELGNSEAIPNFTFEVTSGPIQYFVGCHFSAGTDRKIVYKIGSDGVIDTTWADGGGWHYDSGFGGTTSCYDLWQLADGRLLVAHYPFWVDAADVGAGGSLVACTMLTVAGAIDTSWGHNGHYVITKTGETYGMVHPFKLLRDSNGNFHLFGWANAGHVYNYHIFNESGTRLYVYAYNARHPQSIYDATFNAAGTHIIVVGTNVAIAGPTQINMVALDIADGTVDDDWPGNVGVAGYAHHASGASRDTYAIERISDGYIVWFQVTGAEDVTLMKITSDGSAIDTSWGVSGYNEAGNGRYFKAGMVAFNDQIYTLGGRRDAGASDNTIQDLRWWDAGGNLIDSESFDGAIADIYHGVAAVVGSLTLMTNGIAPASYDIEKWSRNLTQIDGYDLTVSPTSIKVAQPLAPAGSAYDCNPAYMIQDIIEHPRYGAGQSGIIHTASFASCEDWWGAQGMLLSIVIDESKPWDDWVAYILSHCRGYRFKKDGQIALGILKSETAVPNLVADDDLVQPDPDAEVLPPKVSITKRPRSDTYNWIRVGWTDRENRYDMAFAEAKDKLDIARRGPRIKTVKLAGITNGPFAQRMAHYFLIDLLFRFSIYNFTVSFKNMLLENGDVITLTDGHLLSGEKVRIMKCEEAQNCRDKEITAIDDLAEHYPDITYSTQTTLHEPDPTVELSDVTVAFREDIDLSRIYLSVAPGSAQFNGCYIYCSYDDVSYDWIGRFGVDGVTGGDANSTGTTQSKLPSHPTITHCQDESFLVSIGTVTDLDTAITDDTFFSGRKLAKIGDEIIGYRDCEETATAGIWRITNLIRGMFGTEALEHSSGETFSTLDPDFTYAFTEADIGQTLYFKAPAFYGDSVQNIADVSSFSVTIQGYYQRPASVGLLRLTADEDDGGSAVYSGATFTLYWNRGGARGSGFNQGGYDVNSAWPIWKYGDSEVYLVGGSGVPYGNWLADDELQAIVLKFEQEDGTAIGQREISATAESETITKATDLGGYNPARITVVPRRSLEAWKEKSILVDDGS